MKKKSSFLPSTNIIAYFAVIFLAILYSININGKQGFIILSALILFPLFSYIECKYLMLSKRISIEAELLGTKIEKGETTTLRIKVINTSIFPVPLIVIKPYKGDNFIRTDDSSQCVALSASPRSRFSYDINYTADIWGCSPIYIENVYVYDFMGFFRFTLSPINYTMLTEKVKVIPNIPDSPYDSPITSYICSSVYYDNESEETKESENFTHSGIPGYNHKEYEPGDPIRRINWKLSSKKDTLMIRLDDEITVTKQIIILDCIHGKSFMPNFDNYYSPLCDERTIEGMLSLVMALSKQDIDVYLFYYTGNDWEQMKIECPDDVYDLQTKMSEFMFLDCDVKKRIQRIPDIADSDSTIIIFTPFPDSTLVNSLPQQNTSDNPAVFVVPVEYTRAIPENSWIIMKDYKIHSFEKLT